VKEAANTSSGAELFLRSPAFDPIRKTEPAKAATVVVWRGQAVRFTILQIILRERFCILRDRPIGAESEFAQPPPLC
jgi:hypothetical protein